MQSSEANINNRLNSMEKRLKDVEESNIYFAGQMTTLDGKIDALSNSVDEKLDDVVSGNSQLIRHLEDQDREARKTNEMLLKSVIKGNIKTEDLAEQAKIREHDFKKVKWRDSIGIASTSIMSGGIIYIIIEWLLTTR